MVTFVTTDALCRLPENGNHKKIAVGPIDQRNHIMKFFHSTYQFLFVLILCFSPFVSVCQEYNHLATVPFESSGTGKKIISIALASDGRVFMLDDESKAILVYDGKGNLLEKITSFSTDAGTTALLSPTVICLDVQDQLYVYDEELGKIFKRPNKGKAFSFGEKGSSTGQLGKVGCLAADSKGYCYVMNTSSNQIDVYYPDGSFLTWINGTNVPFGDLGSIGVNGADELVVLDKSGPHVFMFDVTGNLVNTNRSLGNKKNIKLEKAVDMTVLQNGDFIILDGSLCQGIHFTRIGNALGTIGIKGTTVSNGVFRNATMIRSNAKTPADVCIFDAASQQVQCFSQKNASPAMKNAPKRLKMISATSARKPAFDLIVAPNQYRYVIPADDHKKVVAYKDTTNVDAFTITGKIEYAVSVAADSASNLFVVDQGADEVLMFDTRGSMIRKFGKEIPDKLKEPTGVVIQRSGNIVVSDKSRGALYMWNSQGVFKKIITSAENSTIKSPVKLQKDSKDQLYVLDEDANCIYRIGSGGWPTSEKILQARSPKPGEKPGIIADFYVDPMDQIHLFNATTHQIEVYSWDIEPVIKFSTGRSGSGKDGFGDISRMLLDTQNLFIYLTSRKGDSQKVMQYLVPPPMPDGSVTYDVLDGKLHVYFAKSSSNAVVAYGLLTKGAAGDSIAFKTTGSSFVISQSANDHELRHYDFVSMSWSDYSDPSFGFDDYFSYGENMLRHHRYEEARGAWMLALEKMGKPQRMNEYIAGKLAETSYELAGKYDITNAVSYAKTAYALLPKSENSGKALAAALKAQYRQFAYRNEVNEIIADAEQLMLKEDLKPIILKTLDSVSRILALEENLTSINNAIRLQKKMISWDGSNPSWNSSLAASYLELYKYQSVRDAASMELMSILDEMRANSSVAYSGLKSAKKPYFETHLILLEGYNLSGKFAETEKQASAELGASASLMSVKEMIAYRKKLATAFAATGKNAQAASEYNSILKVTPDDREVTELLAIASIEAGEYEKGKEILQPLMIGNSDNSRYIFHLGRAELLQGNYSEAVFQLEKAIRQSPSSLEVYGYLAEAYEKSGNNEKALDYYEVGVNYLEKTINRQEQQSILKNELNKLKTRREKYLFSIASIYLSKGNYTSAREYFLQTCAINDKNASALFGLGQACEKQNRVYESMEAYNKALALDENNQKYIDAYLHSVKLRDNGLKTNKSLHIVGIESEAIYPSLYKNYAANRNLPSGVVTVSNNSSSPVMIREIRVMLPELMTQPTKMSPIEVPGYSNAEIRLNALFNENILKTAEDRNLQLNVEIDFENGGSTGTLRQSATLTVRNRNAITWKDKRRLATFVSPNDELLIDYNKQADKTFRSASTFGMNPTILKAIQLYVLLNKSSLTYSNDPAQSYSALSVHSDVIDFLQYPTETMKRSGGDCDDLTALYGALLENGGVPAAYIDMPGHIMLAFDSRIKPADLNTSGISSTEVIIIGDRVWIPVESTMLGTKTFFQAWKAGAERFYKELQEGKYPELVPFADAWQIYQPAIYHAEGYTPAPPSGDDVTDLFEQMVNELVSKTKKESLKELSARYQSESENLYVKNAYGSLLAQTGDLQGARRIFEEGLQISADDAIMLNNMGNTYLMEEKYDQAIEYYQQAVISDDQDSYILINLCKAYLGKGDRASAKTYFDKAVTLDPDIQSTFADLKTQLK
jgi:tetratricopeptide (TPR) repeat protein